MSTQKSQISLFNVWRKTSTLILLGLRKMVVGWSIANQKMMLFAFVVIFSNQILEDKEGIIISYMNGIQIEKGRTYLMFMLEVLLALIIQLGVSVKT